MVAPSIKSLPWKDIVNWSIWISLDFSSEVIAPEAFLSVAIANFFMSRSSTLVAAEVFVRGVPVEEVGAVAVEAEADSPLASAFAACLAAFSLRVE